MLEVNSKGISQGICARTISSVSHSVISDSATLWTVAHQALLFMGFAEHEYWSRLLFPSPEDLPNPGIKPRSPALKVDSLLPEPSRKPKTIYTGIHIYVYIHTHMHTHT